ncbi:MAG: hypothetical protein Q4B09_08470 [Lachnospiraceae bacterium]|nr:hypothetical protein [Lachnospiraceae bacterium]
MNKKIKFLIILLCILLAVTAAGVCYFTYVSYPLDKTGMVYSVPD